MELNQSLMREKFVRKVWLRKFLRNLSKQDQGFCLEDLVLAGVPSLSSVSAHFLVNIVSHLKKLEITGCQMTPEQVAYLITEAIECPRLESVTLDEEKWDILAPELRAKAQVSGKFNF